MCLRFVFLPITRVTAWLRLSRREDAWKTAEILDPPPPAPGPAAPAAALLIFRENGAQVRLTEDQRPVEDFAAQRADETLADRVHPGWLDGADQNPGAGGLEHGVERGCEDRAAVADQEADVPESLVETEGEIPRCCTVHSPVGCAVTPPRCIRRLPCSMNARTHSLFSSTVSTCQEIDGEDHTPRQAQHHSLDTRDGRRAAGPAPAARVVLLRRQPAVPPQKRGGRDRGNISPTLT